MLIYFPDPVHDQSEYGGSEIEKYQYLCGFISVLVKRSRRSSEKRHATIWRRIRAILEIQNMIRNKIIYPARGENITVYDTDGNIFMIWKL
ncbi:MAG: hypothetical protein ACLTER_05810 [Ruminococcus sp.]